MITGDGSLAKHRQPNKRVTRRPIVTGAAAAGLVGVLALGHVADGPAGRDVALAATVIGVGGRDDPSSTRLQNKLGGDYTLGFDHTNYQPVQYPANLAFQSSVDVGVPRLAQAVRDTDGRTRIVSYSEGTLVAEQVRRNLANPRPGDPTPPSPDDLDFVFIASPYLPNGGIFARFPGFAIPGLLPAFSAAQPTAYDSTYVTHEYDGFADFPAYFNPVSVANALLGMAYAHPDQYYDGIALENLVEGQTKFTTVVPKGARGEDTYILVYNPHLPLLAPIRQIASLLMLTPVTEPVLSAVEPLVRLVVDMGYTDRTNANPATPTTFSFITPPAKFAEAASAVPGALRQGVADALPTAKTTSDGLAPNTTGPGESSLGELKQSPRLPSKLTKDSGERPRITHPTLIADGNITRPGTEATDPASTPTENDAPDTTAEPVAPQVTSTPDEPSSSAASASADESAAA